MVVALAAVAGSLVVAGQPASGQGGKPAFTLKYGVLSGLTGDPAVSGQAWNQAAKVGIDYIDETLKKLNLPDVKVELSDSQDSQGQPAGWRRGGPEARSTSTRCTRSSATRGAA